MKQSTFELMASAAAQIELETRRETIDEVIELMREKVDAINKLLESAEARRIYTMSYGDRFLELDEKRYRVYKKLYYLIDLMDEIYKLK